MHVCVFVCNMCGTDGEAGVEGGASVVRAKQGNSTKQGKMEVKCTPDSKGR